jgi:hypothetical protein
MTYLARCHQGATAQWTLRCFPVPCMRSMLDQPKVQPAKGDTMIFCTR